MGDGRPSAVREMGEYNVAMPIHDWTRVSAGVFHDFHIAWMAQLSRRMNSGLLPEDHYAMAERAGTGVAADVLAPTEIVSRAVMASEEDAVTRFAAADPPATAVIESVSKGTLT